MSDLDHKTISDRKSDAIEMVVHEIKTPLTIIKGALDGLSQDWVSLENKDQLLAICHRAVERLSRLIDNHLNIAKIESGDLDLRPKPVNLHDAINHVLQFFHPQAHERHIKFENQVAKELPHLFLDPDRFETVLSNLIQNAIKYSPKGGKITLSAQVRGKQLELSIQDKGVGIPKDDQMDIFKKYKRGRNVKNQKGTGLGLFITKGFIEAMGGTITVKSRLHKGTTFILSLGLEGRQP